MIDGCNRGNKIRLHHFSYKNQSEVKFRRKTIRSYKNKELFILLGVLKCFYFIFTYMGYFFSCFILKLFYWDYFCFLSCFLLTFIFESPVTVISICIHQFLTSFSTIVFLYDTCNLLKDNYKAL